MTAGLTKLTEKISQDGCLTGCHLNSEPAEYKAGVPSTLLRYPFFKLDYG